MSINLISNFAANVALRNLGNTDSKVTNSLAKLSAGTRVLAAKDDAASLAIGSRLRAEVVAMAQANTNAGQASSLLQIVDGAQSTAAEILVRMKSLAVQSSSGQLGTTERAALDVEYQALKNELTRIGNDTEFNGIKLVNGSQTATVNQTNTGTGANFQTVDGVDSITASNLETTGTSFTIAFTAASNTLTVAQTGGTYAGNYTAVISTANITSDYVNAPISVTLTHATSAQASGTITLNLSTAFATGSNKSAETLTVTGSSTTSFTFKVGTGSTASEDDLTFSIGSLVTIANTLSTNIQTAGNASTASSQVSTAIDSLNSDRANIGAAQNRLSFASANLDTARENAEAARSELLDLDVAMEMSEFTSKQILLQAGVSVLAQANQLPQNLLRLFQ